MWEMHRKIVSIQSNDVMCPVLNHTSSYSGEPYVPGSFARKQISKTYGNTLKIHNSSWEDSVSLFYSWLKKEEGSVKDKQISIGDVSAISKAIKEAEVTTNQLLLNSVATAFG